MLKMSPRKAQVIFKMSGCHPFSFVTGRIGTEFKRLTIFGVVKAESPFGYRSAYDGDQVFRIMDAENYIRRQDYKANALAARFLIDNMLKAVLHSEYDQLDAIMNELLYVSNRIHKIQQGSPIEPNVAH